MIIKFSCTSAVSCQLSASIAEYCHGRSSSFVWGLKQRLLDKPWTMNCYQLLPAATCCYLLLMLLMLLMLPALLLLLLNAHFTG
jgi:hypothetical protein